MFLYPHCHHPRPNHHLFLYEWEGQPLDWSSSMYCPTPLHPWHQFFLHITDILYHLIMQICTHWVQLIIYTAFPCLQLIGSFPLFSKQRKSFNMTCKCLPDLAASHPLCMWSPGPPTFTHCSAIMSAILPFLQRSKFPAIPRQSRVLALEPNHMLYLLWPK